MDLGAHGVLFIPGLLGAPMAPGLYLVTKQETTLNILMQMVGGTCDINSNRCNSTHPLKALCLA